MPHDQQCHSSHDAQYGEQLRSRDGADQPGVGAQVLDEKAAQWITDDVAQEEVSVQQPVWKLVRDQCQSKEQQQTP